MRCTVKFGRLQCKLDAGHEGRCYAEPGERCKAFVKAFHANPIVWEYFQRFSLQVLNADGKNHFGARAIGERIRWYTWFESDDPEYKANNDWWPYYARLLMAVDKRFKGFFEVRNARIDCTPGMLVRYCIKGEPLPGGDDAEG